jgi:MOSC domain-containing protein YiiM
MSAPDVEVCAECRFDSRDYTVDDAAGTLRSLAPRWRWLAEGVPAATLASRPSAEVWSVTEYAAHSRDVTDLLGLALRHMAGHERPDFGADPAVPDPDTGDGFEAVVDGLAVNADRLQQAAVRYPSSVWERQAVFGGRTRNAAWVLGHACHDATHHLTDAGRVLYRLGAGAATVSGTVAGLHISDGGVPKNAVDAAVVERRGLVGDRQGNRHHHGRASQALCLWSAEVIAALAAEGHPVAPGSAGENVTLCGLDWTALRPGVRLTVGTARIEITGYANPCRHNAPWFVGGDFSRMDHARHPGWSRVYAAVFDAGHVRVDDPAVVEPAGASDWWRP